MINRLLKTGTVLAIFCLALVNVEAAHAQTYTVIHNFTGEGDGGNPKSGVMLDSAGNLYGTTPRGGNVNCNAPRGCGLVYKLQHRGAAWTLAPLYTFHGFADGGYPTAPVAFGPDGRIYGTASQGLLSCTLFSLYCGVVFRLSPPVSICTSVQCPWSESVLYSFDGDNEGGPGPIVFDQSGNLYGTLAWAGGTYICQDGPCGGVFELSPSGGRWVEVRRYSLEGSESGIPVGGVVVDANGNVYGTTYQGPGSVYELMPINGGFTYALLHYFAFSGEEGFAPVGLLPDSAGNFYGSTQGAGPSGHGTIYKLSQSGGTWGLETLYSFTGSDNQIGPQAPLTMDSGGNLYGTTYSDGAYGYGSVFELTPSDGAWTYTSLHDFTGGSDGGYPESSVSIDAAGNLYGTAHVGGDSIGSCDQGAGCGVIWHITAPALN